jgi:hypothetical protein
VDTEQHGLTTRARWTQQKEATGGRQAVDTPAGIRSSTRRFRRGLVEIEPLEQRAGLAETGQADLLKSR